MLGNIISLLILLALVILFVWLTRRAWHSRRALLRWAGTILAGLLALLSTAVLVVALIGFYKLGEKHSNPVADVQVARTPAQIAGPTLPCRSPTR